MVKHSGYKLLLRGGYMQSVKEECDKRECGMVRARQLWLQVLIMGLGRMAGSYCLDWLPD